MGLEGRKGWVELEGRGRRDEEMWWGLEGSGVEGMKEWGWVELEGRGRMDEEMGMGGAGRKGEKG